MNSFGIHVFGVGEVAVVTGGKCMRGVSIESHKSGVLDHLGACETRNNPAMQIHGKTTVSLTVHVIQSLLNSLTLFSQFFAGS